MIFYIALFPYTVCTSSAVPQCSSRKQGSADPDLVHTDLNAVTCNLHQSKRQQDQVLGLKGTLQLDIN